MSDNSSSGSAGSGSAANGAVGVGTATPSPSAKNSSATASLANVTVAPKGEPHNRGDTCTWYTNSQCYMPRNCYDCINVALPHDECAIDPRGMCVPISTYRKYASMQSNASDLGFSGYFPSANFTYCSVYDATCNACKSNWREDYWSNGAQPAPAMCRGDDGCICTSSCEMPNRVESIIVGVCSVFGFDSSKLATVAYVGGAVIAMVVVAFLAFGAYAKRRANAERERAEQIRAERRERRRQLWQSRPMRTGPPLKLSAWNELRDKLLESEREFLEGGKLAQLGAGKEEGALPGVDQALGEDSEDNEKSLEFLSLSSSDEDDDDRESEADDGTLQPRTSSHRCTAL